MRQLTLGILAHVDAGKTTLSEAVLYRTGQLKKPGRVDHADAFLDTDTLERQRGITIYSKQALFPLGDMQVTLLDTPGHVDFSTEMERALQVLDCAVLVISGPDGVQSHTETLWRLLERYQVPVFLFVNKMDLAGADRKQVMEQLQARLGEGCVDFSHAPGEDAAVCEEGLLEEYLETGDLSPASLSGAIGRRHLFPVTFGSALKLEGVDGLLDCLTRYAPVPKRGTEFGARVFKITRDAQGNRLTWLKLTGGTLRAKTVLSGTGRQGEPWQEKADQLRRYNGAKFQSADTAEAGSVVAVTGLTSTWPGEGLGGEPDAIAPELEPVLTYQVMLPEGADVHKALGQLRELEEEDPSLHIVWRQQLKEIHVQLMGPIQTEILTQKIQERYGLAVSFGQGNILYRETIAAPVIGVGHFEPLRHYAEVHLLIEPGERGSGIVLKSGVSENDLDLNWQRLIFTHLLEKPHLGVLTGSPITDVVITLIAGRAHLKHTEGGDFRQATYRAVRQGLRQAESVLLEPWYQVELDVPADCLGRAISDMQQASGSFDPPEQFGDRAILRACAPVSELRDYASQVSAYTKGRGRLGLRLKGYFPCHNTDAVVEQIGYDVDADVENTADSVFCSHGAGVVIPWDQVSQHQHLESPVDLHPKEEDPMETVRQRKQRYADAVAADQELQAIYEQTYGKVERKLVFDTPPVRQHKLPDQVEIRDSQPVEEYLLVDGYNIIFAWEELNRLSQTSMERARQALMDDLCQYQAHKKCHVILVFDAYRVKGGVRRMEQYHNIHVVFTKEAETADSYIEQASYKLSKRNRVRVATSDGMEQVIVMGHGCLRVSARSFRQEMEMVKQEIRHLIWQNNLGLN